MKQHNFPEDFLPQVLSVLRFVWLPGTVSPEWHFLKRVMWAFLKLNKHSLTMHLEVLFQYTLSLFDMKVLNGLFLT